MPLTALLLLPPVPPPCLIMAMDESGPRSEYVRLSSLRSGWLFVVDAPFAGPAPMGQQLLFRRSRGAELEEIISPKSLIGKVRIQTAQQALEYVRVFSCPRRFQPTDREMGIEIRPIWEVNRGWLPNDVEIQNLKSGDYGVCTIAAFARLEVPVATVEKREHGSFAISRPLMVADGKGGWNPYLCREVVFQDGRYALLSRSSLAKKAGDIHFTTGQRDLW